LPAEIRELADRNYEILKSNPNHGSLHFKKSGALWSVRVGLHYRALATEVGNDLVWFWIGTHAAYDKLVGRKPATKALHQTSGARKTGRSKGRSRASRG
jgi:hypothetical protein